MSDLIQIERQPDFSIIIPTYNKVQYTLQAVASLAQGGAAGVTYELIFVDNSSTDETLSWIKSHTEGQLREKAQGEHCPISIKLIHNDKPRALARSWNMGLAAARGRHLMVSNNDVIFAPGSLSAMLAAITRHQQVGVFLTWGPQDVHGGILAQITEPDDPLTIINNIEEVGKWWQKSGHKGDGAAVYTSDPHPAQGWYCFALRREAWGKVGQFDESYELTGEDYDYAHRLLRHWKMARVPGCYVEHYEHTTCNDLADEYVERLCRNRFRLLERHEGIKHYFSVIIPTHNRSDSLREALRSLQKQTFPHWRAYVIDDGSEWSRVSAVATEFRHDPRIWYFRRPQREGPGGARNYGLALSEGKYVAFLDSDDYWFPNHLEEHWRAHESGELAMAYSQAAFAWRDWDDATRQYIHIPDKHPTIRYNGPFDPEKLAQGNYIQTSGVSVHGELARMLRFPLSVNGAWVGEDWEYFKAVADVGGTGRPVKAIDKETCRYHIERKAHEEEHLIRRALPRLGASGGYTVADKVVIPYPSGMIGIFSPYCVVIPTKDRPGQLRQAIRSAMTMRNGAGPDLCIVVDDGSRDHAAIRDICIQEGACLIRSEQSLGPSGARNLGIVYSPSEFIRFCDDDDTLVPCHLRVVADLHTSEQQDVHIFKSFRAGVNDGNLSVEVSDGPPRTSQLMIRRSTLLQVGMFNESLSANEEGELLDRLRAHGASFAEHDTAGAVILTRGGSGDPFSRSRGTVALSPPPLGTIGLRRQPGF